MLDDMRMRKLTPKTQSAYIRAVCRFTRYLGRAPDTATVEDLRNYQLHLVDTGTSPMSLNAAISGLKFFFDITLQPRRVDGANAAGPAAAALPVVLSREEVARLIAAPATISSTRRRCRSPTRPDCARAKWSRSRSATSTARA
jgi:integrase/recombinase XerD